MKILVLNGPNLNLLGTREKELYGGVSYDAMCKTLDAFAKERGVTLEHFQSNHEGALIDKIHAAKVDAFIVNAGGLTHTSVSLRDALAARALPAVEAHITNIYAREEFRQKSLLSGVCTAVICGMGIEGYKYAIDFLAK
jgi:3-dehydroquinate dehydratase-2